MKLSQARAFLLLRYTLIIATAYLLLVEHDFALPPASALLLVTIALISNVAITLLPQRLTYSIPFSMGVIVYDTAWITGTLLISGRFSAEFFYLYFFVLLLAAIGESLGLIAVGACALCGAYLFGHIASGGSWSLWHSPSLIRIPFLFSTAIFYGYLVDRTRQERRRADASETLTRQLTRTLAELRVLYGKAQEADRLKTEFLATVSHELRTPLVALLGYVDLLLEQTFGSLRPEQAEVLSRARIAGRSLHELITRVLDASRIELRRETVTCESYDLDALIAEVQAELPSKRTVAVQHRPRGAMPPLFTDIAKVRAILRNLIENAIKHTPEGEVVIETGWTPQSDQVQIRVTDTGVGIAPDELPHIFEAFRQGRNHNDVATSGVGLGLYIVKRLVSLLAGEVTVESELGAGSTFCVRLPRVLAPRTAGAEMPAAVQSIHA